MKKKLATGELAPETIAQRERDRSVGIVIFAAIALSTLRVAVWLSEQIVLWHVYGRERVAREHLAIVRSKPDLVVSNGDVLHGYSFFAFVIAGVLWLPSAFMLCAGAFLLLPLRHRGAMSGPKDGGGVGYAGIVVALLLFFTIPGLPPLKAVGIAAAAVIIALAIARAGQKSNDLLPPLDSRS